MAKVAAVITLATVGLLLAACATSYQPQSFSGGFTETQLDKNVFRVSFRGNGYTDADRAEEMALLRSAELTLKNGFTHFVIIDGKSRASYGTYTTPAQSTTTSSATAFGNSAYGQATTTTTGGQSFVITRPSTTNTIVLFQGKPSVDGLVYDAQFVYNSLGQKYGVLPAAK
jgi:hypothetical protein